MVGTLIAASVFGLTAGTVAYAVTVFAVNFALSQIVTRVFGDNPESQQDMGVRQQVPPSAVNAIPVVYGSAYMGGTFVDAVLTEDQKTMYYVLAISCISPDGQFSFNTNTMYYGDRTIVFGTGADSTKVIKLIDEAGNENTKISGNLYINLYTSTAGGTITSANGASAPSTVMGGSDISVAQRWASSNRQMNGLAFAIVKLVYNRDADTTQLSPITFSVNHYLNSTGTAKPGDVWKDYITSTVYGGAVALASVDTASATALNSYSDQLITYKNSSGVPSTQSRYRINGVLDAGQTVLSNIDRIMSASDSWMTYNAALGQWSIVINKAETASYAFNDNNIIGEIRVSATDITSSINQIEARFPFKENRDQAAFVNIKTPTGLLYPNEPVNKYSITYDLVNDSVQTGYLANRLLEQAREDLIVSFSTTYYGIQVDAGNVVSVTNTDYGWNAKLFRVMKVNEASLPDGSLGAKLELSEYNAQVYDDLDITAFTPVPNSGLPSVSYFSPLSAPTVTGYPSATIPNFSVTVFVPTTGRVTFGNLFFTTSPTPTAGDWQLLTSASTANNQPVTNNTYYTYTNLTLNTGTYYFAYQVGNEISNSVISPISAAFVWNPVAATGPTGPTGASLTGPTGATGGTGPTGTQGNSFRIAYYTQSQSLSPPSVSPNPTTGSSSFPTSVAWSGTITTPAAGQSLWAIDGTYNPNTNQTSWSTPYLTQGFPTTIQSDNYVLNTLGWQIQRDTGNAYFNNGSFRGDVITNGDAVFKGDNTTTTNFPIYDSLYYVDYSVLGQGTTSASLGNVRAGVLGTATSTGSIWNAGVIGYASNAGGVPGSVGIGVVGSGYSIGGYFSTYPDAGIALVCTAQSSAFIAFQINQGKFNWGAYSIPQPTGSTTTFLRNDGTWATPSSGGGGVTSLATSNSSSGLTLSASASTGAVTLTLSGTPSYATSAGSASTASVASDSNALGGYAPSSWARIFPTNSGTANAGGSGLNILGSGTTGIVGAYVATSGTSNIVTIEVTTTSPSDVRLKEEIADSDLGLAFVKQLRPVSYKLKADSKHQKGYGFIADEVDQIIESGSSLVYFEPDWKVGEEKGFKTIHYPSYIAVLTKAIQELSAQVEELKKQIPKT
jgi:hypothetical protein